MPARVAMILTLTLGMVALSGCAPLVIGGGVIAADTIAEHERGGDGLF